ncbi:Dolichyl-phosphate-mannose--protein mannosyltransferase 4 [Lithohypha guttulata]|uniref:Dolichyl-phosphate-mannose--protein mannosyltransferase n=1 Tax=Lithohypha guttulata TaxID=1690604 RepID=A0AAN7YIS4_9EURO|nr:Dolichyl-phosphate-mannose--protein mannosyltransferase 4 [Lithohypha guttulata]
MSSPNSSVRQRVGKEKSKVNGKVDQAETEIKNVYESAKQNVSKEWDYKVAISIITFLAFATRFTGISHPNEVVFDEVHFGKFASYYLQRLYFFDVHPPFAKLLFAFVGWLVGFDGHFLFENIGDSYIDNKVPYVAFRALPALLGTLTVPIVFLIMWESGYSLPACVLASCMVLFDNSHIGQTRLILLDATLVFFMALSVLCYIKFYRQRHDPFGRKWWKWLLLTGFNMSCVMSTKYVGLFIFVAIGCAVAIDLWDLLDINRKGGALDMVTFGKHFAARAVGLIIVPFFFYLFWFQVHFAILTRSGPGDDFMSPEFQETLSDNPMHAAAVDIHYYDSITLRHKDTKVYLHSHTENYPLRYDDGRISSQGQQVTGYPFNDTNNHWQVLPHNYPTPLDQAQGNIVRVGDVVQLRHVVTNTMLLSHDVASPYYPTNQEFTTVSPELAAGDRHNDTLFEIRVEGSKPGQSFKSMSSQFKLVHYPTKVAMWTHTTPLPEWAFKQAEINGNKNVQQTSNIWYVDDIAGLPDDSPRRIREERKPKHVPFLKKYFELQRAMFYHNNALTASHPYASLPFQWPFLLRGVSFWTQESTRQQIYFLGNPLGYWIATALLAVFAGIVGADQLSLRRGVDALDHRTRSRFYNSTGFFFLCWALHYFPFYLMGRQLFLHHYLPAHLASCLVAGALVEFIFNVEPVLDDETVQAKKDKIVAKVPEKTRRAFVSASERMKDNSLLTTWIAVGVIMIPILAGWYYFLPLTYGRPGLTVEEVNARKWLGYDLHFAK